MTALKVPLEPKLWWFMRRHRTYALKNSKNAKNTNNMKNIKNTKNTLKTHFDANFDADFKYAG